MSYFPLTKQPICDLGKKSCAYGVNLLSGCTELFDVGNIRKEEPVKILYPVGSNHMKHMGMSSSGWDGDKGYHCAWIIITTITILAPKLCQAPDCNTFTHNLIQSS